MEPFIFYLGSLTSTSLLRCRQVLGYVVSISWWGKRFTTLSLITCQLGSNLIKNGTPFHFLMQKMLILLTTKTVNFYIMYQKSSSKGKNMHKLGVKFIFLNKIPCCRYTYSLNMNRHFTHLCEGEPLQRASSNVANGGNYFYYCVQMTSHLLNYDVDVLWPSLLPNWNKNSEAICKHLKLTNENFSWIPF